MSRKPSRTLPLQALIPILLAAMVVVPVPAFARTHPTPPAPTAPAAGIAPIPADRAADTYAIYGMLLPGEPFNSMPPNQTGRWAIADTTISIVDMNPAIPPDGQLKAPDDNAKAFREALHDYEARRYQRFRLSAQDFHLTHPFSLLTDAQVGELRQARSSVTADSGLQGQYAGYPGVTFFTQVFFNSDQTAALVYRNNWCANLCSGGSWVYLEKHGGKWVLRSGITAPGA
jgi:hypothetical protein